MRKAAIFLLILVMLVATTGAAVALHHSHDHDAGDAPECQICLVLKIVATAILLAALVHLFTDTESRRIAPRVQRIAALRRADVPVGLRAPPLA